MPSIQQNILRDDSNDKRSLISESATAIQIGIHHAGKEPEQHVVRVTSRVSRTTIIYKSLLSQTWAPAPGMKSCPPTIIRPGRQPGLPHSPSNKPP
jgi:hypothetical protein